jgi:molybdopterin converting factor small subunit
MAVVRFFAAAEEAVGTAQLTLPADDLGSLRETLSRQHPDLAAILPRCSVLVDGARLGDEAPLPDGAVVDVLPPFAGG